MTYQAKMSMSYQIGKNKMRKNYNAHRRGYLSHISHLKDYGNPNHTRGVKNAQNASDGLKLSNLERR
jgi:hypothetical protein